MDYREHLLSFLNKDDCEKLLNFQENREETHSFRLNILKYKEIFSILEKHPFVKDAYIYNKDNDRLGKSILFEAGAYYIQEPAAMMAEYLLNVKKGEKILDMCAAPGGKTFNAFIDNNDEGLIVSADIHEIRAKILSSNIEKYGFTNTLVLNQDSSTYKSKFINFFDKIILDAPCSGSAMFRKNEQAKNEWSIKKVLDCQAIQKRLIEDAYLMLKNEGMLLYSTCSFSKEENEDVIIEFLSKHSDMKIIPIDIAKKYNESIGIKGGLRLYPFNFNGEGQCIFLLKKEGVDAPIQKKFKKKENVKIPKIVFDFLESIKLSYNKDNIKYFNNYYWLVNFEDINLDRLKVLRYGLQLGSIENNRFIPSHSLAMSYIVNKSNYIDLTFEEACNYYKGLTINKEGNEGYKIVSYQGLPLGWVKQTNNVLKNHLPKGLRRQYLIK